MARSKAKRNYTAFKRLAKLLFKHPQDFAWFWSTLQQWRKAASAPWLPAYENFYPITRERFHSSGHARGHYFLQDLWAAQHVYQQDASQHVDVGSSLGGFVAHVASFCPVAYVDIRPLECDVPGITWVSGSILELPFNDNSLHSLSCLHVIEHIGLGRYGDPIQPDAWQHAAKELSRVLAPGGQLLLGTPVGRRRVVFNAHRVFLPCDIIEVFSNLSLLEFSLVTDEGSTSWIKDAGLSEADRLDYGCGLFRFTK